MADALKTRTALYLKFSQALLAQNHNWDDGDVGGVFIALDKAGLAIIDISDEAVGEMVKAVFVDFQENPIIACTLEELMEREIRAALDAATGKLK